MTRFVQENWIVIIFAVAMLAMHLGHRGGQHSGGQHGGGQHGGARGCGGGHAGHQDTSSTEESRSRPESRKDGNATPQDSTRPRDAKAAPPLPVHPHH